MYGLLVGLTSWNGFKKWQTYGDAITQTVQFPAPNIHFLSDTEGEEIETMLS